MIDMKNPRNPTRNHLAALTVAVFLSVAWLSGCATLKPGADPVVVRAEQTQTAVEATFDLIIRVNQMDRRFWRTNSPKFHAFVETLRAPVPLSGLPQGRPTLPRYLAVQWELDRAKLQYKAAKSAATSNALVSTMIAIDALSEQATAWTTIITNRP